jgi:release factor glutamine methyltransferase
MQVRTALQQGLELLREGHVGAPELTAEVLLHHALRRERVYLYSHPEYELTEIEWLHYGRYLHERLRGKPTQYITRVQEFWGRDFHVEPGVLIPRPETEHVVEQALAVLRVWGGSPEPRGASRPRSGQADGHWSARAALEDRPTPSPRILDIGTGSGILAVTLALEAGAATCATDLSAKALAIARSNAHEHGAHCRFVRCDLGSAFADASFDLVVSNPPYIESAEIGTLQCEVRDWEPHEALDGGASGMEIYARLIPEAARLLRSGGWLVLEIGATQGEAVPALFDGFWQIPEVVNDLAGLPRVVKARVAIV